MNDTFAIEEASRGGVRELIGLYGFSSGGKTHSALILARGIVGPKGRIGVIDTENKRASIFADLPPGPACPGKFKVINLDAPFSPGRYIGALKAFEKEADIVVVDSATHEWAGEGGVQEMHEEALDRMTKGSTDYKERDRLNWPAWREPKMEHKALVMYLLRYPLPLIICLRGKILTSMQKDERGRNTVVTAPHPVPDFDNRFLFEMLIAGQVYRDDDTGKSGLLRITKLTRDEIAQTLPKTGEQITVEHGAKLAAWCRGQSTTAAAAPAPDKRKELLALVRDLTVSIHHWKKGDPSGAWAAAKQSLQQWCWDENLLADTQFLDELQESELSKLVEDVRNKLQP